MSLPAQEPVEGTYMEIQMIAWLIKNRLTKGNPEGETSRVWDDILHDFFRSRDGYSTGPEMSLGKGRADLFTAHLVLDTRHNEKKFLIVECKAPGLETQDAIWSGAETQLVGYLKGISGGHRRFGAVAVGKVVRFYEWNSDGLISFDDDKTAYYLDRQCRSICSTLEYFRTHH